MKALEALKYLHSLNYRAIGGNDLDEAIKELEELMKPKGCEGCAYFNNALAGLGRYCFVLERQVGEKFYCSEYTPKEIA